MLSLLHLIDPFGVGISDPPVGELIPVYPKGIDYWWRQHKESVEVENSVLARSAHLSIPTTSLGR